eukprot:CAMPEP_0173381298 /NCGR_PEP_ID=MMETSP1356-20130122/3690_1 /TAXON_ID=77927 ORGANISM="Hemiselmis virescens, Strain PCC157" /NCGR_SAMPLE_ID=MMETSP1356 /ASSEMBLY_ACC=CAM_ASM_000847 /LENGTH=118 /DNA_ID=CAMNT_0014335063 /DNA_START=80 /DNA_END=436 /DNA_ORIENTATION=+
MEAFVAADGMAWAMRKAASAMGWGTGKHFITMTMTPGANEIDVQEKTPMFDKTYKLICDGEMRPYESPQDKNAVMSSAWDGASLVHVLHKDGGKKVTNMRRTLEGRAFYRLENLSGYR